MSQEKGLLFFTLTVCCALGASFWFSKDSKTLETAKAVPQKEVGPSMAPAQPSVRPREVVIANTPRILISNDNLLISVNQQGLIIDDVELKQYHASPKKKKPLALLCPEGTDQPFYVQIGCLAHGGLAPKRDAFWDLKEKTDNMLCFETVHNGLIYQCRLTIDSGYAIDVQMQVVNKKGEAIDLASFAQTYKTKLEDDDPSFVAHEGLVGYMGDGLQEKTYSKINKENFKFSVPKGGWTGFASKYWFVCAVNEKSTPATSTTECIEKDKKYTSYMVLPSQSVAPQATYQDSFKIFVGPKKRALLADYEQQSGWKSFEQSIDYGVFYFVTRPFLALIIWLYSVVGNFGIVILMLTLAVRLAMFPLARRSHEAMLRMRKMQPKMKRLQELYSHDKMRMHQEIALLYKNNKVNPLGSFLPMLVQVPIFFALYKVLFISLEMRHASLLWIQDLSQPDPTSVLTLCGLLPITLPGFLTVGVLPVLMAVTMYIQQRLTVQPTADPTQQKVMRLLPFIFMFMLANFSSGLVFYWMVSNVVSIAQQWYLRRNSG